MSPLYSPAELPQEASAVTLKGVRFQAILLVLTPLPFQNKINDTLADCGSGSRHIFLS